MNKKAKLTEGPIGKTLAMMALPMMVGFLSMTLFNLADTFFVAKLGTRELAAMTFTFPVVMVLMSISIGIGMGAGSVVSRAIGKGDFHLVRRFVSDSLSLAALIVLIFSILGFFTINPLFRMLGADSETLPLVRQYMSIWYIGMVFVVVPMVGNNSIRATGDTTWPSIIMTFSAILNVAIDPILIFGLFGFPRMELAGAAIATVIARGITCVAALYILHFREKMIDIRPAKLVDVLNSWKQIMYIGLPAAATNILMPIASGVITRFAADLGQPAVAALGAGSRIGFFAAVPLVALSSSLIPYIGQNWGARKFDRVHAGQLLSYRMSFIYGILQLILFWILAEPIAKLFSQDEEVLRGIILYLRITPIGLGVMGIFMMTTNALNAINRPLIASCLMVIRLFIFEIPLAYAGLKLFELQGMFGGAVVGIMIASGVALLWIKHIWKIEMVKLNRDDMKLL